MQDTSKGSLSEQEAGLWGASLPRDYPDPNDWKRFKRIHKRDIYRFAALWMSEGVPYAFRNQPMSYAQGRETMARVLDDDPKHISVTGSGRIGYSLAPSTFGRPFVTTSDFDLFIVSPRLFDRLSIDGNLFVDRVKSGQAVPASHLEGLFWEAISKSYPEQRDRGFIDQKNVPAVERYPTSLAVAQSIMRFSYRATGSLKGGNFFQGASLRVYHDWKSAISQMGGSLIAALVRQGHEIVST